ncbi:MAG: tetratricopeptide repeat protein [Sphingobacteriaceae bacterium]|nr:tetratricopeptide repeat protein [Sphingobacteriaceae bacterium]
MNCTDSAKKIKLYEKLGDNYHHDNQYERFLHFNKKGLDLATYLKDTSAMITFNIRLVNSYGILGARSSKLTACFNGLKLSESKKDSIHVCEFYRILGEAYWNAGDNKKAINYYSKALTIAISKKDTIKIAGIYNNLGLTYRSLKDYDVANDYYFKSIELGQLKRDKNVLAKTFNNIAYVRYMKKDLLGALEYYNLSLKNAESIHDEFQVGLVLGNIGAMHSDLEHNKEAEVYFNRSLVIAKKINDLEGQIENYSNLAELFESTGKYKLSLENYRNFLKATLKFEAENKEKDLKREDAKREYENEINEIQKKQELKDAVVNSEKEKNRMVTTSITIGFILVVLLLFVLFNRFKLSQAQKMVIEEQKKLVDEKQKEILNSIHYAKRIQTTLLAHKDFVDENIENNFIYFQPKDIVSGDFYWATKQDQLFYLAVCDSTGHGVPGAFMSLLNIGFLSEAINEKNIIEPSEIFDHVRKRLISGISKEGQKDGFDGILMCLDKSSRKIKYVGANNAPILIRKGACIELELNKMPVGIGERHDPFVQGETELQEGDSLFLYTDGFADQFGGPKGKKFKYNELNKILVTIANLPLAEQRRILESTFNNWKGDLEQVDDVLIVGIKF